MADEPRGAVLPEVVEKAREGQAPGFRLIRDLLGEGTEVLIDQDDEAYQVMHDEAPVREGYINLRPMSVVHQNLAEVDDREHPPVDEDDDQNSGELWKEL
jgi:hypothetical protein